MSDGEPHPTARIPVLSYNFAPGDPWAQGKSITIPSSRLALLREVFSELVTQLIVWNWITGEMLLVCQLLLGDHTLMWTIHLGTQ